MVNDIFYLEQLQRAAEALKQAVEERNAAGLALAMARDAATRAREARRHEGLHRKTEELKQRLLDVAARRG